MRSTPRRLYAWGALAWLALLTGCVPAARSAPAPAVSPLVGALDSLFADTALQHAHWGVLVRNLTTGETLYERDARKAFTPASTMKTLTGAAALALLGPEHRYRTSFFAAGPVRNGTLQGDLVVRGSGDPTLSERFGESGRVPLQAWADSLRARGITRIAGGIIGVDSAFVGPSLGAGWAWDDLSAPYAAEISALQFNEGAVEVQAVPSRTVGQPGVVILDPATQYVHVNNATVTTAARTPASLQVTRDPNGPGLSVSGTIPLDTVLTESVAVRDPAAYFLAALRETLREAGVGVEGQALRVDEWPEPRNPAAERPLFTWASPPLREILPAMLKPSHNGIAETLLRSIGIARRGEGSTRAGVAAVDSLLRTWQLPTEALRMSDGSGLSRYDLLSPELLVGVLTRMRTEPTWELWYSSLPSGGQSGTLENRMKSPPLLGKVHAKTGTLSGVRTLAGYLENARGEMIDFAIIANNYLRPAATVDRVAEAALSRIAGD